MKKQDVIFRAKIVKNNTKVNDTNVLEYKFINLSQSNAFTINNIIRVEPQIPVINYANAVHFHISENENDCTIYEVTFDNPFDPDNNCLVIMKMRANYQ